MAVQSTTTDASTETEPPETRDAAAQATPSTADAETQTETDESPCYLHSDEKAITVTAGHMMDLLRNVHDVTLEVEKLEAGARYLCPAKHLMARMAEGDFSLLTELPRPPPEPPRPPPTTKSRCKKKNK